MTWGGTTIGRESFRLHQMLLNANILSPPVRGKGHFYYTSPPRRMRLEPSLHKTMMMVRRKRLLPQKVLRRLWKEIDGSGEDLPRPRVDHSKVEKVLKGPFHQASCTHGPSSIFVWEVGYLRKNCSVADAASRIWHHVCHTEVHALYPQLLRKAKAS